jgi:hypothetical protein
MSFLKIAANLGTLLFDEMVVSTPGRKHIPDSFVIYTREQYSAHKEVFPQAVKGVNIKLCRHAKAFAVLCNFFQVGHCRYRPLVQITTLEQYLEL